MTSNFDLNMLSSSNIEEIDIFYSLTVPCIWSPPDSLKNLSRFSFTSAHLLDIREIENMIMALPSSILHIRLDVPSIHVDSTLVITSMCLPHIQSLIIASNYERADISAAAMTMLASSCKHLKHFETFRYRCYCKFYVASDF
jgi:hypothetical protein